MRFWIWMQFDANGLRDVESTHEPQTASRVPHMQTERQSREEEEEEPSLSEAVKASGGCEARNVLEVHAILSLSVT